MIPTSGVRQLHYWNQWIIAAFSNSTKKCDGSSGIRKFYMIFDV